MILKNKKARKIRVYACVLLVTFCTNLLQPVYVYALTGGPTQPEFSKFSPADYTQMVDLFTGDFNYNIPLFTVGDYPINLSYNSNIASEQEASWVGLGWTLNPGAINRSIRGLPDDFDGDIITNKNSLRPNRTFGTQFGIMSEVVGLKKFPK